MGGVGAEFSVLLVYFCSCCTTKFSVVLLVFTSRFCSLFSRTCPLGTTTRPQVIPPGSKDALDWGILAGYEEAKRTLEDCLLLPLQHPEVYERVAGVRLTGGGMGLEVEGRCGGEGAAHSNDIE